MSSIVLRTAFLGLGLATIFAPSAFADGDVAAGKKVFVKCQACHTLQEGKTRQGPSLYQVVGRKAGTLDGFRYSTAMKGYGEVWTEETLDKYLANPRGAVPGTRMAFPGLKKADERADVIAYIEAASK